MIFRKYARVKRQVSLRGARHGAARDLPGKSVKKEKDFDSIESNRR